MWQFLESGECWAGWLLALTACLVARVVIERRERRKHTMCDLPDDTQDHPGHEPFGDGPDIEHEEDGTCPR